MAEILGLPLSVGVGNNHDLVRMYDEGRINVKKIHMHPDFDQETVDNDIALLELDESLELSDTVLPGCLDTQRDRRNYGDVVATGFGLTSKLVIDPMTGKPVRMGSPSRFLKELENIDTSETDPRCHDFKSSLCVDSKSEGTDESVCLGDSGMCQV